MRAKRAVGSCSTVSVFVAYWTKHERTEFGFAEFVCDFLECKERDECDTQQSHDAERADYTAAPELRKAFGCTLTMKQTNTNLLKDVCGDKQD